MHRIECTLNNYAWGKHGENSEVAKLFAAGHKDFQIAKNMPYSELWMGTHPDGPARIHESSEKLSKFLAKYEASKFSSSNKKEENHLPFIMKIMSIKHTLSLQVHPTKEQAAYLHKKDPINYPDSNHKPELAYALTKFELLCGFRPAFEIIQNIQTFPEFRNIMGKNETEKFEEIIKSGFLQESEEAKAALKKCFTKMLYSQIETPNFVAEQLQSFYEKLESGIRGALFEETITVLLSMKNNFPNDVGCFSPLYLNHMILQPGECCFYAAEELHAYLSGECVECVGCSNNTIRAALTPKFIDREALINVLNYRMTAPEFYLVPPKKLQPNIIEFAPDCKDFTLHEIKYSKSEKDSESDTKVISLPSLQCGSIMVIVEGEGKYKNHEKERIFKRGDIFYIEPEKPIQISTSGSSLVAYRTFGYETEHRRIG
uniref:mannose-6-phosphate isomerase n=1 Tax=Panagrolaimus davidi TaxID=227884 RepID=A0A914QTP8_9BILA